jgi:CTD nuclear envelope phosphatase 1
MNSLNFISGRSPTPPYSSSRRSSYAGQEQTGDNTDSANAQLLDKDSMTDVGLDDEGLDPSSNMDFTESTPLLAHQNSDHFGDVKPNGWRTLPKRITTAIIGTTHVIIHTITSPARYVIAYFYDDEGRFHPFLPFLTICRVLNPRKRRRVNDPFSSSEKSDNESGRIAKEGNGNGSKRRSRRPLSTASASTAVISDSEVDEKRIGDRVSPARHTRSKSIPSDGDEIAPQRRSIRIKLHNEESLKKRRRQQEDAKARAATDPSDEKEALAMSLKSPNSPGSSKLKFPRAPFPPRPLVPRRQPSYSKSPANGPRKQKTLVIDLDETLIHSQAKGGRFSTGHMVEVKIQNSMAGGGPFGPQVPILYYVHKRPNCDEFLRKVCTTPTRMAYLS